MFNKVIGQDVIKNSIVQHIRYSTITNKILPHMLFIASAGYGKTLMATELAHETNNLYIQGYGPNINSEHSLVNLFVYKGNLIPRGTILFVDEIHAIKANLLEKIYTIIEGFSLPTSSGILKFNEFTLIASTTDPQYLTKSMRDRFKQTYVFTKYTQQDIIKMVNTKLSNNYITDNIIYKLIYEFTAGTPRQVLNMAENIERYCIVNNIQKLDLDKFNKFLYDQGMTKSGLTTLEFYYLGLLYKHNKLSLHNIVSMLNINTGVVLEIVEPRLLERGLILTKSGGRILTDKGRKLYVGELSNS